MGTHLTDADYWSGQWRESALPAAIRPETAEPLAREYCRFFTDVLPNRSGRFLEIGCGCSVWLPFFARLGFEIAGLDYSDVGCRQARMILEARGAFRPDLRAGCLFPVIRPAGPVRRGCFLRRSGTFHRYGRCRASVCPLSEARRAADLDLSQYGRAVGIGTEVSQPAGLQAACPTDGGNALRRAPGCGAARHSLRLHRQPGFPCAQPERSGIGRKTLGAPLPDAAVAHRLEPALLDRTHPDVLFRGCLRGNAGVSGPNAKAGTASRSEHRNGKLEGFSGLPSRTGIRRRNCGRHNSRAWSGPGCAGTSARAGACCNSGW
jgi:hypothetical protein